MNHDPKAATQRKKATFAGDLHLLRKLRGKDLNLRPLGYECKFSVYSYRQIPIKTRLSLLPFMVVLGSFRQVFAHSSCTVCS